MTVKPVISNVTFYINGVVKPPGTYRVKKGDTIGYDITIVGEDGGIFENTSCLYWLLNKKTGKSLVSRQFTLRPNQQYSDGAHGITVEGYMDLVFQTWYWNGSKWVHCDEKGDWVLNTGSSKHTGVPAPYISRDDTYLIINGEPKPPGNYSVKEGDEIGFKVTIVNMNSNKGNCYVWLIDDKGKKYFEDMFTLGDVYQKTGKFTVEGSVTLRFQSWVWKDNGWKLYDQYGNWNINKGSIYIDKSNTYIEIDGKIYPPGTYKINPNAEGTFHIEIVNNDGTPPTSVIISDYYHEGSSIYDKYYSALPQGRVVLNYRFKPCGTKNLFVEFGTADGRKGIYGYWTFNPATTHPVPVFNRGIDSTFISIKGKHLLPGEYTATKGEKACVVYSITNKGWYGKCRIDVVDVLNNRIINSYPVHLDANESITSSVYITLDKTMELKLVAYGWDGTKWIKTDEVGCND